MSSTERTTEVDYPETDGQPMGETDWHIDAIIRLREILRRRYRDQNVYVGSDLLVYYDEGTPYHFVVPDVFVAFDCAPGSRRVFKTWEEEHTPDVVFEVTSRSTAREDAVFKPRIYGQLGVRELFLYDPTGEYLQPPLKAFRLSDGQLIPIEAINGRVTSQVLGIELSLQGDHLRMSDSESGEELLTAAEAEHQGREAERQGREAERAGRLAAEAELSELRAELERLRRERRG